MSLARLSHLTLPAYAVGTPVTQNTGLLSSGFSFTYTTGTLATKPGGWSGRSVKAADAQALPILYTQGLLNALWDTGYAGFGSGPNTNLLLVDTTPAWGSASSLVRRPRIVTFPANAAHATDATDWAAANASWLTANGIAVVQLAAAVTNLCALESGLPLTGVQIVNEGAFLGDYAVGVADPSTFVAGEVWEFRKWLDDYTDNGAAGSGFHTNQANADVATNQALYPRFAKRQVVTLGSFNGSTNDNTILAYYQGLLSSLSSYGFAPTIHNTYPAGDERSFYDSQVAAIQAFFGV